MINGSQYSSGFIPPTTGKLRGFVLQACKRYEGFWEFKVLGYVSLLDEYVSTYAEIANQKVTKAENKKVKNSKSRLSF